MGGLQLGRIMGIRIGLDWSLVFIFWLITFNLGAGAFPSWHPDWSPWLTWTTAVVAAILFFASVLAHELAHALVAKAHGIPVRSITLFIFGGMANIERDPSSPRVEALMAGVGPLTSLALGVLFLVAGSQAITVYNGGELEEALRNAGPASTLLLWLGPLNIMLGLFNLVPGLPLDGGRILRAVLWGLTGDLHVATRWASRAGQAVGLTLMLLGLLMLFGFHVPYFGTGWVSGLWLVFIGWFLHAAATASQRELLLRELLMDFPVSRLMRRDVPTLSPDLAVSQVVDEYLFKSDQHAFPVVDAQGFLEGLVCLTDVRKVERHRWDHTRVADIMTARDGLMTVTPQDDLLKAWQLLRSKDVGQLPVLEGGRLLGMLRRQDILRWADLVAVEKNREPPVVTRPSPART